MFNGIPFQSTQYAIFDDIECAFARQVRCFGDPPPHQVDAFASLTPTAWSTNGHSATEAALLSASW